MIRRRSRRLQRSVAEGDRLAAVHEAAHAVAAWAQGVRLHSVSVSDSQDYVTRRLHARSEAPHEEQASDLVRRRIAREVRIAWAGMLALKIAKPRANWHTDFHHDEERITKCVARVYQDPKMQWHWSSLLMLETQAILREHWPAVTALADELLNRSRLTGQEARTVILQAMRGVAAKRDSEPVVIGSEVARQRILDVVAGFARKQRTSDPED